MTPWEQLRALYDRLQGLQGSFIVRLTRNRSMLYVGDANPPFFRMTGPKGIANINEASANGNEEVTALVVEIVRENS